MVQVDEANFPDEKLREVLIARYGQNIDETSFRTLVIDSNNVTSLKGIDKFTNLTYIDVYPNNVRTLDDVDLSKFPHNSYYDLKRHFLFFLNQLTELDISGLCLTGTTSIVNSVGYCYSQIRYGLNIALTNKDDYPYQINLRDYVKEKSIEIINEYSDKVRVYSAAPRVVNGDVSPMGSLINSKYYNGVIQCESLPQAIAYYTHPIAPTSVTNFNGMFFNVFIVRDINITTETLKNAVWGKEYIQPIEAESTSLTLPMQYSIVSGELPPGLTLKPDTGEITGTPT